MERMYRWLVAFAVVVPPGPFEVVIGEDTVLEDIVLASAAQTAATELY